MSQNRIDPPRDLQSQNTDSARENSGRESGVMPHSYFGNWLSDENHIIELAIRLSAAPNPVHARKDAESTLSTLLPDFQINVETTPNSTMLNLSHSNVCTEEPTKKEDERVEQYKWPLSEELDPPQLALTVRSAVSSRDRKIAVTLSDRVASLVSAAHKHFHERRQLEIREREASQLLDRIIQTEKLADYGQVVAGVLHELNNPLTAIVAYSDFLSRTLIPPNVSPSDLEMLARIREAAERAQTHARSLVEYARPSNSRIVEVQLAPLLKNALLFSEHVLTNSRIHVAVSVDELTRPIYGIPNQLTQLFVNLFTNAAHAARSEHAELRITACSDEDPKYAKISVCDNGIGIQENDINHIFDPFFTTKRDGKGFGLGLAIVKDIVTSHSGKIQVSSVANVETCFYIWLPVAPLSSSKCSE
jgi:signal transduction histidine kinase